MAKGECEENVFRWKKKRTKMKTEEIETLVNEVVRRRIVLTESLQEWLAIAYSLAEGGESMRDAFHKLASMAVGRYNRRDSDRLFSKALKKVGQGGGCEMGFFVKKCREHGVETPSVPLTGQTPSVPLKGQTPSVTFKGGGQNQYPTLDASWVERCRSDASSFCRSLVGAGLLTDEQARRAAERYRLGAMRDGSVIYWLIDEQGRLRDGKVMMYGADCHRLKSVNPNWMSWLMRYRLHDSDDKPLLPPDFKAERCLFGLHLLANARPDQTICVVEAEKTAVICAERVDTDAVWMAAGGLSALNTRLLAPLVGRRVMLFPDTDTTGEAFGLWSGVAARARSELGLDVVVSDILERLASDEQKGRKVDVADWVCEQTHPDGPTPRPLPSGGEHIAGSDGGRSEAVPRSAELDEMVRDNPDIEELIETFGLVIDPPRSPLKGGKSYS